MKYIFLPIIIIGLFACNPSMRQIERERSKGTIVYVLPKPVSTIMVEKMKKYHQIDSSFFILGQEGSLFVVFLGRIETKMSNILWIQKTNRKICLNGRFYPLLLDSDEMFAIKETKSEILEKANAEKYFLYTRIVTTGELFYVKFDRGGTVAKTGY